MDTRIKFKLTLDVDSSLTREQLYRILDDNLETLLKTNTGVSMYRYELPRKGIKNES